jgi:hypothetical protein
MTSIRSAALRLVVLVACLQASTAIASAQGLEVTPFGGYRFGGDFFELLTQQRLDLDGAPAFGVAVDVPTPTGVQFEALFTHQDAHVTVPDYPFGTPVRWNMTVEHYQAGGLQEFDGGRVRPFLTGMLGLTRYAANGDNEVRFSLGAGGGVKLFPWDHVGLRLNSQVFATFVDADAGAFACGPVGTCLVAFHADVLWQMEFTAGLVVKFH